MCQKPERVWYAFTLYTKDVIKRDIDAAGQGMRSVHQRLNSYLSIDRELRSPEAEAKVMHLMMIQAHAVLHKTNLEEKYKTVFVAYTVYRVAEVACQVAISKGRLGELAERMRDQEAREGFTEDDYVAGRVNPADYRRLFNAYHGLVDKVLDAVVPEILKRYYLHEQAEFFENDRGNFDDLARAGREEIFAGV